MTGAGTDYQVKVIVHYGSGTDTDNEVYLNRKCESDFCDIRFTSADGELLDYWMEPVDEVKYFADNGVSHPLYHIISPSAEYYNGKTYITWQGPELNPYITYYDHTTGLWGDSVQAGTNPLGNDDHGCPSILIDAKGYIHIFFGSHQTSMAHVKSDNPEDISSWTKQDVPAICTTYPKPIRVDDDVYLFYRKTEAELDDQTEVYKKSTDNCATWETEQVIIDFGAHMSIYAGYNEAHNGLIHMMWCNLDVLQNKRLNIYHAFLNTTNEKMYCMDGTDLGTTINKTEADTYCLVEDTGTYEADMCALHLDSDGNPYMVYPYEDAEGWHQRFARWNGAEWETKTITDTDTKFNFADFIIHSTSNIECYLITSGEVGRRGGDVEKWIWNGASWTFDATILTQLETGKALCSPMVPYNFNSELKMIFCEIDVNNWNYENLKLYAYSGTEFLPIEKEDTTATFWVKISEDLSIKNQQIYIYYGNNTATSLSNGANTFIEFWDFSDLTYDGWTAVSGTWDTSEGYLKVSTSGVLRTASNYTSVRWGFTKRECSSFVTNHMHTHIMGDGGNDCYSLSVLSESYANPKAKLTYKRGDQSGQIVVLSWDVENTAQWNTFEVARSNSGIFKVWMNNEYIGTGTDTTLNTSTYFQLTGMGSSEQKDWDNIFVAKYVNPEPAHGDWSAEESVSSSHDVPPNTDDSSDDSDSEEGQVVGEQQGIVFVLLAVAAALVIFLVWVYVYKKGD